MACRPSPSAHGPRSTRSAPRARGPRPGRYVVGLRCQAHRPADRGRGAPALAAAAPERVVGMVLTPHSSTMGSQEYLDRAAAALAGTPFVPIGPWFAEPALVTLLGTRVTDVARHARRPSERHLHRPLAARAHRRRRRHLSRPAGGVGPPGGRGGGAHAVARGLAERRAHPRALARPRRARRGPAPGGGGGTDAVVVCPIGFVADHLEVLFDLDVELAAVAHECGIAYARTASLNDDPAFISVLADVIAGRRTRRPEGVRDHAGRRRRRRHQRAGGGLGADGWRRPADRTRRRWSCSRRRTRLGRPAAHRRLRRAAGRHRARRVPRPAARGGRPLPRARARRHAGADRGAGRVGLGPRPPASPARGSRARRPDPLLARRPFRRPRPAGPARASPATRCCRVPTPGGRSATAPSGRWWRASWGSGSSTGWSTR